MSCNEVVVYDDNEMKDVVEESLELKEKQPEDLKSTIEQMNEETTIVIVDDEEDIKNEMAALDTKDQENRRDPLSGKFEGKRKESENDTETTNANVAETATNANATSVVASSVIASSANAISSPSGDKKMKRTRREDDIVCGTKVAVNIISIEGESNWITARVIAKAFHCFSNSLSRTCQNCITTIQLGKDTLQLRCKWTQSSTPQNTHNVKSTRLALNTQRTFSKESNEGASKRRCKGTACITWQRLGGN